ncbi:MAG: tetratricopeptide repeat protein [Flavobacteriales bacterium]|nr:tetratricopeptide repeat protein [Flavobacteriales bacterium]
MVRNHVLYYLKAAILVILVSAGFQCSTKKDAVINRAYHNMTGHYNAYFNGHESFKEGKAKLARENDDYTKILPIFQYGTEASAKTVYPEMDNAILKASKVIQRHEIIPKGKSKKKKKKKKKRKKRKKKGKKKKGKKDESVHKNWIDDSYLLIGKANFYKRDFPKALEAFEYVSRKYKKHPIKFPAMIWIVKTHIEQNHFTLAQTILDLIEDEKNKPRLDNQPRKVHAFLAATKADFFMKKEAYGQAIKPLLEAIALSKKRKERVRYTFILAQLYQHKRDYQKASRQFLEVLKMSPSYEMAFNAQINRARGMSGKDTKAVKRELERMLKDEKNSDYFDQVYFALADLSQRDGEMEEVVMYLNLSIRASKSNTHQKGLAYERLGDINFDIPDYPIAEAYYDSAQSNLNPEYDKLREIVNRKNSLKDIVKYLKIIAFEDSVQRLAGMTYKDRKKVVQKIIEDVVADKRKKKAEDASPKYDPNANKGVGRSGGWYFYNPTALSFGYTEFSKKWGDRKLEDNWRRKNKRSNDFGIIDEPDSLDEDLSAMEITGDVTNMQSYMDLIPTTRIKMQESEERMIDAYYNLGIVYKELMDDKKQAAVQFEELLKRFPTCKYQLSCYYQLYRVFLDLDKVPKSNYYKNAILKEFPDSDYAKLINNPDYIKQLEARQNKLENYYSDTYRAYRANQYVVVINRCEQADSLFKKNELKPKFSYLRALAIGKHQDISHFEAALKDVIAKYPNDPVRVEAQKTLALIASLKTTLQTSMEDGDSLSSTTNAGGTEDISDGPYSLDKGTAHLYVIVVPDSAVNINDLKKDISNFNTQFFRMERLKTSNLLLNTELHIILVKNFGDSKKGIKYFEAISENISTIPSLPKEGYQQFIISKDNLPVLYKEKAVDGYLGFFQKNYLGG